jgi:hypothetical protein
MSLNGRYIKRTRNLSMIPTSGSVIPGIAPRRGRSASAVSAKQLRKYLHRASTPERKPWLTLPKIMQTKFAARCRDDTDLYEYEPFDEEELSLPCLLEDEVMEVSIYL